MISDALNRAVSSLALTDIVLASIAGEVDDKYGIGADLPPFQLETVNPATHSFTIFVDDESDPPTRRVQYRVSAGARLTLPKPAEAEGSDQEPTIVARVETSFLVTYQERSGADLSADELNEFAEHNVPFNVWPYWREVVHASFSRMGLPRVLLPLYRMKRRVAPKVEQSEN